MRGKHNYILVDEIQDIIGWERTIRSFRTEDKTDIIITGSNSKMLSSELSTLLSGRYEEIHIQPLSYLEFLEFHRLDDGDEAVQMYLEYGGLPGLSMIGLNNEEHVWEYLRSIFNTVLLKDVIERYKIRNITFLNNLLAFWADTIGKVNSATSICKYMKSQQQDVSTNIILDYTSYFEEAY
ncbi:MAG: ATP-binding protein, partial [Bacteroidales bacterium]|nr:ATP-binding protein [Bacteroidales bacterium]